MCRRRTQPWLWFGLSHPQPTPHRTVSLTLICTHITQMYSSATAIHNNYKQAGSGGSNASCGLLPAPDTETGFWGVIGGSSRMAVGGRTGVIQGCKNDLLICLETPAQQHGASINNNIVGVCVCVFEHAGVLHAPPHPPKAATDTRSHTHSRPHGTSATEQAPTTASALFLTPHH